jgi:hypothetical protein
VEIMHVIVQVLLIVLLATSTFAAGMLIAFIGDARRTIARTTAEVDVTLKRVDAVVTAAETVLVEEVGPTLRTAREALSDLQVTTRALADVTVAARVVVQRVERASETGKLAAAGGAVASFALRHGASAAGGLLSSVASGIGGALLSVLRPRGKQTAGARNDASTRALPPPPKTGAGTDRRQARVTKR